MTRTSMLALLGIAAFLFLFPDTLHAQGAVIDGDFEIADYAPWWTLTGSNLYTEVVTWETSPGNLSYSLKRRPGLPSGNGGIQQTVALVGGVKYAFSAEITSLFGPC